MITFFVPGTPRPQGSKRAIPNRYSGKVAMVESGGAPLKDWRGDVKRFAVDAMGEQPPLTGPVSVDLQFLLVRPKSHPKTRPTWPTTRPDVDKLARACLDAFASVCFVDDAQVVSLSAGKAWAEGAAGPGVWVTISGTT